MGSVSRIGNAVFRRPFGKSEISIVDEKKIGAFKGIFCCRTANVNIQKSVVIYVGHGNTGIPQSGSKYTRLFCLFFKFKISLIDIKVTANHISGKIQVYEAIIIEVTGCHTTTIV